MSMMTVCVFVAFKIMLVKGCSSKQGSKIEQSLKFKFKNSVKVYELVTYFSYNNFFFVNMCVCACV